MSIKAICPITGNECGSDTWSVHKPPDCDCGKVYAVCSVVDLPDEVLHNLVDFARQSGIAPAKRSDVDEIRLLLPDLLP